MVKLRLKHFLWALLLVISLCVFSLLHLSPPGSSSIMKVAFIGDTTVDSPIFSFLVSEKVDLIVHQGDLTYLDDPELKFPELLEKLSQKRPVLFFSVPGNQDIPKWKFYAEEMEKHNRKQYSPFQVYCEGEFGVQSFCHIGFLLLIQFVTEENSKTALKSIGYLEKDIPNEDFIQSSVLKNTVSMKNGNIPNDDIIIHSTSTEKGGGETETLFRVCSFHHPQDLFRLQKPITDQVGLREYEVCRKNSALLVSGHDHLYVRTFPILNFMDVTTTKNRYNFVLDGKVSVAVINGLGGKSVDDADVEQMGQQWWAEVWPIDPVRVVKPNEDMIGALLCDFDKIEKKAICLFKTIDGNIHDKFSFSI